MNTKLFGRNFLNMFNTPALLRQTYLIEEKNVILYVYISRG